MSLGVIYGGPGYEGLCQSECQEVSDGVQKGLTPWLSLVETVVKLCAISLLLLLLPPPPNAGKRLPPRALNPPFFKDLSSFPLFRTVQI